MAMALRMTGRARFMLALVLALALIMAVTLLQSAPLANAQSCYTLTTQQHPYGGILTSPAPNCGSGYTSGTAVTLTARYASCFQFNGWTGDASGTQNPTSIVMNSSKYVGMSLQRIGWWC
jgi:hypothetical protein